MRIIQVNKYLYAKGGADKYCLEIASKLKEKGHELVFFGMDSKKNQVSAGSSHYIDNIDYHKNNNNNFSLAKKFIWNKQAVKNFSDLIDEFKPDIIHYHNIYHQLSPSILEVANSRGIPSVMTVHDYNLVCPNYLLFSHGKICKKCVNSGSFSCLLNNCYNSYPKSALASMEHFLNNTLRKVYKKNIDLFISPSQFMKDILASDNYQEDKLVTLINPAPEFKEGSDGSRLLYFGRLSQEKGVDVLLKALTKTKESLDIVGSGPEEMELKKLTEKLNLSNRVSFLGRKDPLDLKKIISSAKAVIIPSVWLENMPLALLESLSLDKIVIASNCGGIKEIIQDNQNGFLFEMGDAHDLADKINNLNLISPQQRDNIRSLNKEKILEISDKNHLERLLHIYKNLIEK